MLGYLLSLHSLAAFVREAVAGLRSDRFLVGITACCLADMRISPLSLGLSSELVATIIGTP